MVEFFPKFWIEMDADEIVPIATRSEGYRMEEEHPTHIRDANVTKDQDNNNIFGTPTNATGSTS